METASVIRDQRDTNQGHCHQRCLFLDFVFAAGDDFRGALLLIRVSTHRALDRDPRVVKIGLSNWPWSSLHMA